MNRIDPKLERMRAGKVREINVMRWVLYVATAAAAAASMADLQGNAPASALGNFGLLLIMARLYVLAPVVIARTQAESDKWQQTEYEHVEKNYPWADMLGKAGWVLLMLSVLLQVVAGMA